MVMIIVVHNAVVYFGHRKAEMEAGILRVLGPLWVERGMLCTSERDLAWKQEIQATYCYLSFLSINMGIYQTTLQSS